MCGIFGLVVTDNNVLSQNGWHSAIKNLFFLSETRGKEAAGIAVSDNKQVRIYKDSVPAGQMLKSREYKSSVLSMADDYFNNPDTSFLATIGHSRLVTNGVQGIDANNQPISRGNTVIVHNGIVVNVDELWQTEAKTSPKANVDTEIIAVLIEQYRKAGMTPVDAVNKVFSKVKGETSIALLFADINIMILATNTGSLYYSKNRNNSGLFFVSEMYIAEQLSAGKNKISGFSGANIEHIRPKNAVCINLVNMESKNFSLTGRPTAISMPATIKAKRIEEKSEMILQARKNMRRCSKCVLPETMPYISFDAEGICNYCHNYQKQEILDENKLLTMLDKIRSKDGTPDCVVAFSGGRDSSYGLHLLKTKYNMNPIAYTYDWGMVTDLARRNQARMCGQLGVEHLWLSANIKTKRAHVRRNIQAWLKKPDLGIIPLFMAGDKQFFWYANDTMKKTGINTMVFCTNRLEKTDFKSGFLGIAPKDKEMRNNPSSMQLGTKINMAWQYGRRFLSNPGYINKSLPDTLWAYLSYYFIRQDHLYLFDYINWNEREVDQLLIDEYDWETAPDSKTTWRIGDGTAPFYNHVYLTVAGFTEHDTFRSNQIREGMISRDDALKHLEEENITRWDSIREYMNMINIDFDEAMRVIDRIPKLYMR